MAYPGTPAGAPYTDTGALSNIIKVAYDQKLAFEFTSATLFRQLADKKVVNQTQPGSEVIFSIHKKMAVNLTPLNETVDGNETVIDNPTQVSVKVNEHGAYTVYTEALMQFAFDDNLASNVINTIKTNQLETIDGLVAGVLSGGNIVAAGTTATAAYNTIIDGVVYGTLALATAAAAGITVLTTEDLGVAAAELRSDSVPTWDANSYVAFMHPKVARKFRASVDAAGWLEVNKYNDAVKIYAGETGTFEGIRVIETPRVPVSEAGVYTTFVLGKEALAEVVSLEPSVIVDGDIPDPYGRKTAIGWYGILGWNLFRSESLYTILSTVA